MWFDAGPPAASRPAAADNNGLVFLSNENELESRLMRGDPSSFEYDRIKLGIPMNYIGTLSIGIPS